MPRKRHAAAATPPVDASSPGSSRPPRRRGVGLALAVVGTAALAQTDAVRLADLPLEQLRDVVVSSVSRSDERLDQVAASIVVISGEQVRRSGARTLPEALRLAPTLHIARADASRYAIGSRGFASLLTNGMLVLIDGRTVYTPLFSGVFWEAQDVPMESIERIEVVTGPSTALWGSNAVTGLIHVITRPTAATQGTAAAAWAGNAERGGNLRIGGEVAGDGHFRVYAKDWRRDGTRRADRTPTHDAADGAQVGARVDWVHDRNTVTLQGDAYRATTDTATTARRFTGANVNAHWQHDAGDGSQTRVQLVVDHSERDQPGTFTDRLRTVDGIAQHAFVPRGGHRVVVGGGVRTASDATTGSAAFAFVPADRRLTWRRLFVQDQVQWTPALTLTASTSIEGSSYSPAQWLPSFRLAWSVDAANVVWASVSRASRAPSRIDRELFVPAAPPHAYAGGPDFRSERSDVAEVGWRLQPSAALTGSLTLYRAEHRGLRSLAPTPEGLQFRNDIDGHSAGIEAWARWQATQRWSVDAGTVLQRRSLQVRSGAVDAGGMAALGNPPRRQASLRSSLDFGPGWRWDASVRRVGALPDPVVPAYTAIDSRLAWQPSRGVEWSIAANNLFDPSHPEWGAAADRVPFDRRWSLQLRLWH